MEKFQVKGVEVTFDDLTEEVQRSLYLKDREKFQIDAARSQYSEIRKLVVSEETATLEALNEVFKAELGTWKVVDNIKLVWNHKNFKRTDDKRQVLAKSIDLRIRLIAAKCEDSSSEFLNDMLRNEVSDEGYDCSDVATAILDNPKFQLEQDTLEMLAKSEEWETRLIAAKCEDASSEFLNEILRNEISNEDYQDSDVEKAILDNPKFRMEQETLEMLAKCKYYRYRLIAAKCREASSEFLNEMLRNEIVNEKYQYDDIERAILNNPKIQIEQETLKVLAKSKAWKSRMVVAKSKNISTEFLEDMYQKEEDSDVLKAIENNLLSRNSLFNGTLNLAQKVKFIQILKKVKNGEEEGKTLFQYMEEILEIIS